jgi:general stress protein CsbA
MKLRAPKNITFYVAVILAVLGLISAVFKVVPTAAFWLVLVGFVLLALGNLLEGL